MTSIKDFTKTIMDGLKNKSKILVNYGKCPKCSKPIIRGKTGFGCSDWKNGCKFSFLAKQFGYELNTDDVQALLFSKKTGYPKKLIDANGDEVHGYIIMNNKSSKLEIEICKVNKTKDSIGNCPMCGSSIIEKFNNFACFSCEFVVWKKIAKKEISKLVLKTLLEKNKTEVLKGFKSKAGKSFNAALTIKEGRVSFDFPPR